MAKEKLADYRAKRDFAKTNEPAGGAATQSAPAASGRFVVQEHHATRLHWDLRLEHEGALASWAVPNGIPDDPKRNHLAVRTEDHPLEYLEFHGEIPKGQYGAGSMTIWDTGTYEAEKWRDGEVIATFEGERMRGRYALIRTGARDGKDNWLIHRMDPPVDPDAEPMPQGGIVPMLAKSGKLPRDEDRWSFEVKWDGIRALVYSEPGTLRLETRNLRDVTATYPELRRLNRALSSHRAILDGEIVAFDEDGRPSFGRLQHRMHVTSESVIRRRAKEIPVVLALFDLLWLDGHSLLDRPYSERREALESLGLQGPNWQTPPPLRGTGTELLEATARQGLEGLIIKRLDSCYEAGRRTGAWLKVKNVTREEFVIVGWEPGEGRRSQRIGSLLVARHDPESGDLVYAGEVGTGFTEETLQDVGSRLEPLRIDHSPLSDPARAPRKAFWVEPLLQAEIEYANVTNEGMLRHPSFKGLRLDKEAPVEVVAELPKDGREVDVEGHRVKISNFSKVLWPKTGFTKGDLVAYYARAAPTLLPHLAGRMLTLKRYPNGVEGQHFYEKQCPSHRPPFVETAEVDWGKTIRFCVVENTATLVWLANLADIELHTSLARVPEVARPSMMVFDLDPGAPADIVQCCEVGLVLRGLFEGLGLQSLAKTSGSKGLQIYVPLNRDDVTYDDTKLFSKAVAELLEQQMPELVVSRQTKSLRGGKILVDWSQNDEHKTTVNVYSVRAKDRPTVSTPVMWDEVRACLDAGDADVLSFDTEQVLGRIDELGDLFAPALTVQQKLPAL